MKVLVTGGSGYLGQFIVAHLAKSTNHSTAFTFFSSAAYTPEQLKLLGDARPFRADVSTGEGLDRVLEEFGEPDVVVNCAALSVPRECEANESRAAALNVPSALIGWMESLAERRGERGEASSSQQPLLIHLSTDQVYDGQKAWNQESDSPYPVNIYGKTKVAAEDLIRKRWQNYVILRSSIIVGPHAPLPLAKSPPLLWMDSVLSAGNPTDFFFDEFRCPIFVLDLVHIVEAAIQKFSSVQTLSLLANAGGPDRLSRAGMAEVLAEVRGYGEAVEANSADGGEEETTRRCSLVRRVSASTAVNRGVASPADISMDVTRLKGFFEVELTPFADAVRQTFA